MQLFATIPRQAAQGAPGAPVSVVSSKPPIGPIERQTTSVWSFPSRGDWGPHRGTYRGNWSPHVPRNLILKYTSPGDLVLDPMMGSGTSLVECLLLGRNGIGIDINPRALGLAASTLGACEPATREGVAVRLFLGDARRLGQIPDNSVHLVTLHPPYADIIRYSDGSIERDLSSIEDLETFFASIREVAAECRRVLKPGGHCGVLMGDTRRRGHLVPLSFRLLKEFLEEEFVLREHVIKLQWNTTSERTNWAGKSCSFYKIAHEHLFVFRKPFDGESSHDYEGSRKWWSDFHPTPRKDRDLERPRPAHEMEGNGQAPEFGARVPPRSD